MASRAIDIYKHSLGVSALIAGSGARSPEATTSSAMISGVIGAGGRARAGERKHGIRGARENDALRTRVAPTVDAPREATSRARCNFRARRRWRAAAAAAPVDERAAHRYSASPPPGSLARPPLRARLPVRGRATPFRSRSISRSFFTRPITLRC